MTAAILRDEPLGGESERAFLYYHYATDLQSHNLRANRSLPHVDKKRASCPTQLAASRKAPLIQTKNAADPAQAARRIFKAFPA
jgi:hypothetical protein